MDVLAFRDYCLSLPFTEECTPFDETTLVYKVGGRMYAFADMVGFERIALKCDPEEALLLRERYPDEVTPAWHTNKRLWNDVRTTGDLPMPSSARRYATLPAGRAAECDAAARREEILARIGELGLPE